MDSWWCGKNVGYRFLLWEAYNAAQMSGAGSARNPKSGFQNSVSHVDLWRYDPVERGAVTLYSGDNCTGQSAAVYAPKELFATASYTANGLRDKGFVENITRSVRIPFGYTMKLWHDNGFRGDSYTQFGDVY